MSGRVATMSMPVVLRPSQTTLTQQRSRRAFVPAVYPTSTKSWAAKSLSSLATNTTTTTTPVISVYDSHGDYHADAKVFEDLSLPLYASQNKLPHLPVPTLENTCQRFLPTALPLASSSAEAESLEQAVAKFPQQASILHERLLERAKTHTHSSWLQEWWNTHAYLKVRDPIVVHVSYFFRCDDDPNLERLMSKNTFYPPYQPCVARSAAILPVAINYAQTLLTKQSQPATIDRGNQQATLCSAQYKYMFHGCRIPQKGMDVYCMYCPKPSRQQQQQHHVVIAVRGQFFAVPVHVDHPYSQRQWRHMLHHCIDQTSRCNQLPSLGWFTGMNRDMWAEARDILLQQGLQDALTQLESALFMICLDVDEEIQTDRDRSLLYWHGRSDTTSTNYHNRWHDKGAAIIVTQNGKLGFQGEHSMVDGMPCVAFCDAMVHQGIIEDDALGDNLDSTRLPCSVTNIFEGTFATMSPASRSRIDTYLAQARQEFLSLTNAFEMQVQNYQTYGANTIKKAGFSPDAYAQMALQLASYRMFGEPLATYESTQVRRFLHGRTETTRTVSPASVAFCQAMKTTSSTTDSELRAHRHKLLQEACQSHVNYIRNAAFGQGVDRHFLGLLLLCEDGEDKPDLFSHALFAKSKHYRLSTSSLPNMAVGFGPVVEDGFGIGYDVKPTSFVFHVTSRKEHNWTSAMSDHLAQALNDMRSLLDVVDNGPDAGHGASRL